MASQRSVASFLFFMTALLTLRSIDVAFCGEAERSPKATQELAVDPVASPTPEAEGIVPDSLAEEELLINAQEEAQLGDSFMYEDSDHDSDHRRMVERPITTKRLYTTRGTARADPRRNTLKTTKLLSVGALLLVAALAVAFKGKLWPSEDDEESDEEDERQPDDH